MPQAFLDVRDATFVDGTTILQPPGPGGNLVTTASETVKEQYFVGRHLAANRNLADVD